MTNVIGKMITNSNRFVSKTDLGNVDLSNFYYYGFFNSRISSSYSDESGSLRYNAYMRNSHSLNADSFVDVYKTAFADDDKEIAIIQPGTRPTFGVRPSGYNHFYGLDDGTGSYADVIDLDKGKPAFGDVVLAQSCLGTDKTSGNPYGTIKISALSSGLEIKLTDVGTEYANEPQTHTYTIPKEKFIDETIPKRLLVEIQAAGGAGSTAVWNGGPGNGGGAGAYWCGVINLDSTITIRLGNSYAGPGGGNGTPGQAGTESTIINQYGTTYLTVGGGGGGVYGTKIAALGGTIRHYESVDDSKIWTISERSGGYGGTYDAAGQNMAAFDIKSSYYLISDATGWESQQLSRGGHISGSNGGDGAWGGASAFSDGGQGSTSYYARIGGFGSGGAGGDDGGFANNDGGHGGNAVCLIHLPVKEKIIDWY